MTLKLHALAGKVTILENIHTVIECLIKLISYSDLMVKIYVDLFSMI